MSDPDKQRGLYRKFRVERLHDYGGKHPLCTYYVLDLDHDPHAIPALRAYAASARADGFIALADDIEALLP